MLELIFAAMALGIVLLVAPYFALQADKAKHLTPLLSVLLSLAVIATGPAIFMLWPSLIFGYIAFLPLAFFALSPGLWLYTCALTAERPWQYRRSDGWHYLPMVFAAILAALILSLPLQQQLLLFFAETSDVQGQTLFVSVVFLVAVLFWLGQSACYLWLIIRRVKSYRQKLRQVFAEEAGKRLTWLELFFTLLLSSWIYAVVNLLLDKPDSAVWLSDAMVLFSLLLLVWSLAWVGLTQQPGFSETYEVKRSSVETQELKPSKMLDATSGSTKYQRSALGEEQSLRIATKLQQAMQSELLYLDETLTLYKLADHLVVPAHYLSQTLNQTLQMSFFEYVNQARVEAAKQKLRQSDASVLTIAMSVGFSARSSFYKAFKANTGQSPAEFRAACQHNKNS
jgi:AraC-like DNA-binding protein